MLKSKQRPYKGLSLSFQKEPQDSPIPVVAGHSELQSPEREHPKSAHMIPDGDVGSLCHSWLSLCLLCKMELPRHPVQTTQVQSFPFKR